MSMTAALASAGPTSPLISHSLQRLYRIGRPSRPSWGTIAELRAPPAAPRLSPTYSVEALLDGGKSLLVWFWRLAQFHGDLCEEKPETEWRLVAPCPQLTVRRVYENGDIGFCVADWSIAGKAPDGKDVKVGGTSAEVVKKTSGGNWVYVIDSPYGTT
jgi:hypothetical protein